MARHTQVRSQAAYISDWQNVLMYMVCLNMSGTSCRVQACLTWRVLCMMHGVHVYEGLVHAPVCAESVRRRHELLQLSHTALHRRKRAGVMASHSCAHDNLLCALFQPQSGHAGRTAYST